MKIEILDREFVYNGAKLADPAPAMALAQVRDFYSNTYPEIVNADIEGPVVRGNKQIYTFRRAVGTKGMTLDELRAAITTGPLEGSYRAVVERSHVGTPLAIRLHELAMQQHRPISVTRVFLPSRQMPVLP